MNENVLLIEFARILIGFTFVFAAFANIYYWQNKVGVIRARGLPKPDFILSLGITIQIVAGSMIICNFMLFPAAMVLVVFIIVANYIFHDFWNSKDEAVRLKIQNMNTSIGLIGALLLVAYLH